MLNQLPELLGAPDLEAYRASYGPGETLFLEGDASGDLYILLSGKVQVLKGQQVLRELKEPGTLFGEMSHLLGGKRTATIKTSTEVEVLRVPESEISAFSARYPFLLEHQAKVLAQRLRETSQVLHGWRDFCDHIPDAVVLTDTQGAVLSWNSPAERLFGQPWQPTGDDTLETLWEDRDGFRAFLEKLRSTREPQEMVLRLGGGERRGRPVALRAKALYDGHHNQEGLVFLGRDATATEELDKRYRRMRVWLAPLVLLVLCFAVVSFWAYPYLTKGYEALSPEIEEFQNLLTTQRLLIENLVSEPMAAGDRKGATEALGRFFEAQDVKSLPLRGVILLDEDKRVFALFFPDPKKGSVPLVGSSYSGIPFDLVKGSCHSVLSLYRADKENPMGRKWTELAFCLNVGGRPLGWLLFHLDMDKLRGDYGLDQEGLAGLKFRESPSPRRQI